MGKDQECFSWLKCLNQRWVFKCDVNHESSIKCGLVNGMAITPGIFRRAVSADVNGSTAEMGSDSWAIITAFFFPASRQKDKLRCLDSVQTFG